MGRSKKLRGGGNITDMLSETFTRVTLGEISQREAVETIISVLDINDMDKKDLDGAGQLENTGCGVKAVGEGNYGKVLRFCLNVDKTGMDWRCSECSVLKITKPPEYGDVKDYAEKHRVSEASAELSIINQDYEMLEEEYMITEIISENIDQRFKDHTVKCQKNLVPNSGFLILEELKPIYRGIKTFDDLMNFTLGWFDVPGVERMKHEEFIGILCQILGTLAHIRKIVPEFQHNDLHCDNIMITSYQENPPENKMFPNFGRFCAKIIDYGMATSAMPNFSTTSGRTTWTNWLHNPNQDALRLFSSLYMQIIYATKKLPAHKQNGLPQYLLKFCNDFERGYNFPNTTNEPQMNEDFYQRGGFYGFPPMFTTTRRYYRENIMARDPETIYQSLKEKFIRDFVTKPPLAPPRMGGTGV